MQNLKHLSLLLLLLVAYALPSKAQTVDFSYDQTGNRLSRTIKLAHQGIKRDQQTTDSVVVKETIGECTIKVFPNPT